VSLTRDPKIDVSEAKTIRLAGEDYYIPLLMLRQTVKIGPLIPQILRIVNRRSAAFNALAELAERTKQAEQRGEPPPEQDNSELMEAIALSEEETTIAIKALAAGLSRAYPGVTVETLYDMPIEIGEIVVALTTVIMQTRAAKQAGDQPAGEAAAASL
jgi:hypothetical protein